MNALYVVLITLFVSMPAVAQTDSAKVNYTTRRSFADHDEEILLFGKRNDYFTVRTLLKNGSLFRQDSYTLLPKTLANGFQLDSISRIIRHGPTKIMYASGQVYISCEYKNNALNGPFMVFYEDGTKKRREYYKLGRLSRSECYTPDGTKQACAPFYQPAAFQGQAGELAAYLKQKLGTVIDGERIRGVRATLTINEIGQIISVKATVMGDQSTNRQLPDAGSFVQQVIRTMPEWSPDKLNWKPALSDGVAIRSTCVMSIYRAYGALEYRLFFQL
ncbi:toxin-antitoxin system YwqK family antitoxin [Spirosoma pollinicola]|uniref:TonB C-terminal domain-containing protein n=1 Tax=Spirosoma pollinicola TaxID=2057025 RepID=A0A2K8Z940_9BACT|nr:hypothetical protein [Spirosoma pollinicola]AUD06364.1 hypothetical protein CWM47_33715 [Spirosoma pollinicola]